MIEFVKNTMNYFEQHHQRSNRNQDLEQMRRYLDGQSTRNVKTGSTVHRFALDHGTT